MVIVIAMHALIILYLRFWKNARRKGYYVVFPNNFLSFINKNDQKIHENLKSESILLITKRDWCF